MNENMNMNKLFITILELANKYDHVEVVFKTAPKKEGTILDDKTNYLEIAEMYNRLIDCAKVGGVGFIRCFDSANNLKMYFFHANLSKETHQGTGNFYFSDNVEVEEN